MTRRVTLPEASSADGDGTLWASANPQPGPTSELPIPPSQLLRPPPEAQYKRAKDMANPKATSASKPSWTGFHVNRFSL